MESTEILNAPGVLLLNLRRVFTVFKTAVLMPVLMGDCFRDASRMLSMRIALFYTKFNALFFRLYAGFGIPTFLKSSFTFLKNFSDITTLSAKVFTGVTSGRGLRCTYNKVIITKLLCLVLTLVVQYINMGHIVHFLPPIMANPVVVYVKLDLTPSTIDGTSAG